jgi:hypothetical protein
MTYISVIKEGIATVNKNWQLVLLHFGAMLASCIGFFVIVGAPVAIAFIMFGLDFTEILRLKDIYSAFGGTAKLFSKYFSIALLIILSILIYFILVMMLWIFMLSATTGILKENIINPDIKYSFHRFLSEGKKYFMPLFWFSSLVGIIFTGIAFVLGIAGGIASGIIEMAKSQAAALALFLGVFFSLILFLAGFILIIAVVSVTVYGIAYIAFNKTGSLETMKGVVGYLFSRPSSIGFYAVLIAGYMLAGFIVILVGFPFTMIPLIGPLLSLPYQIVTYFIQGYVNLLMMASIFIYYYKTGYAGHPIESSPDSDTSAASTEGQTSPQVETVEPPQE